MGQKLTLNTTDNTYVAESKSSIVDKMIAGVTGIFDDSETVAYSPDVMLWGHVATNVVNVVATSMYTRKRADDDEEAIFGVLF